MIDRRVWRLTRIERVILLAIIGSIVAAHFVYLGRAAVVLHGNDFGKMYFGVRHFAAGESMYAENPATFNSVATDDVRPFWNLNPPHAHVFVWPLALMSLPWAFAAGMIVNAVSIGACLKWIARQS